MKELYTNRELSWVEFNGRVLAEGCRKDLPLFERLKFLSIVSSNFDEFFNVRGASLKRIARQNPETKDHSGMTALEVLHEVSVRCHEIIGCQNKVINEEIIPLLEKQNLVYVKCRDFSEEQKEFASKFFKKNIFPLLSPQRTDSKLFPTVINQKNYVAFLLDPVEELCSFEKSESCFGRAEKKSVALVQIPPSVLLNQLISLPEHRGTEYYTLLEDIICFYGNELFPGFTVSESLVFKVDRDADMTVDEDSISSDIYIHAMKEILIKRQTSFAVRMVCSDTSVYLKNFLKEEFALTEDDIYVVNNFINPGNLLQLSRKERFHLEKEETFFFSRWKNFTSVSLPEDESLWNILCQRDVILNTPYESYDSVIRFIRDAAVDKKVLAIKITLYRIGSNSPIVQALKEAARNGKQVMALVELKARFDEQKNILQGEELEKEGVTVVYGIANYKVHAKICLVVRKEGDGLKRYVHIGTGNYNSVNANQYQDFSLLTSNHFIANDATLFFNVVSGYSIVQQMHYLYMAPINLKNRIIEMIEREISFTTKDTPGLIMAKMNSLCHPEIIQALYRASNAGVKILLNVRGICTLVPGVKGMSENIQVVSIIDRYLEHSRIFYFQNGMDEEIYLSSADWMERNLDRRVELMFPVIEEQNKKVLIDALGVYFRDNRNAYVLKKDGTWEKKKPLRKGEMIEAQAYFYNRYKKIDEEKNDVPKTEFLVRRK